MESMVSSGLQCNSDALGMNALSPKFVSKQLLFVIPGTKNFLFTPTVS
jgi:hypothetical protein